MNVGALIIVIFGIAAVLAFLAMCFKAISKNKKIGTASRISDASCEYCSKRPACRTSQQILKGSIIMYRVETITRVLCLEHCIEFRNFAAKETMIKGWWSIRGFWLVPFFIFGNFTELRKSRKILAR